MKCIYCEATGTLRRVQGITPTGHKIRVPICESCRHAKKGEIDNAKEVRRQHRAAVEYVKSKMETGKRRRKVAKKQKTKRRTKGAARARRTLEKAEEVLAQPWCDVY